VHDGWEENPEGALYNCEVISNYTTPQRPVFGNPIKYCGADHVVNKRSARKFGYEIDHANV
jgi:hypothetical protein